MRFTGFTDKFAEVTPRRHDDFDAPSEPPSPAARVREAEERRRRGIGPGVRVTAQQIVAAMRKAQG